MKTTIICHGRGPKGQEHVLKIRSFRKVDTFFTVTGQMQNVSEKYPKAIGTVAFGIQWGAEQFRLLAQVEVDTTLWVFPADYGDWCFQQSCAAGKVNIGRLPTPAGPCPLHVDLREIVGIELREVNADRTPILRLELPS